MFPNDLKVLFLFFLDITSLLVEIYKVPVMLYFFISTVLLEIPIFLQNTSNNPIIRIFYTFYYVNDQFLRN